MLSTARGWLTSNARLLSRIELSEKRRRPHTQPFVTFASNPEKALPPRFKLDETDLEENFLKGSGPGGQKINKTNSAVQLTHIPTGTVLKCQATRSRTQNRKIARQLLAEKIEALEKGVESRVAIKAERASKKKASGDKKRRRKYRALEAAKSEEQGQNHEREAGTAEAEGEEEKEEEKTGRKAEKKTTDSG